MDRSAAGLRPRDDVTLDGLRASEVILESVRVGSEAVKGGRPAPGSIARWADYPASGDYLICPRISPGRNAMVCTLT